MKILAIETSGNICGAAVISGDKIIAEKNIFLPKNSSSKIFDVIKNITRENLQFNVIAVDVGPGSFTGIRVGVSLARAYGQFLRLPIIGVSCLDCLVFDALKNKNVFGKIFPVVDALRGEVYTAEYEGLKRKTKIKIIEVAKFLKMLDNKSTVAGSYEICRSIPDNRKCVVVKLSASAVGFMASKKLERCEKHNYNEVLPLYIRRAFAQEHYSGRKSTKRY
ncbi:MAG: tRNA (adenosine(37)-N6)-threonylcarbamoyltransferase complex dimerization subunit type 1 TsaB [Elusimicrobia bacterium CG06_land_8_20_14_3_00_38_11]|nr:MAG: tRNA (adenosine(37)-N6)-threonylcarbamoyltransferase complex dimerization subunit type 1 TsaB [Elusimicrobia bacterium CG06_land_8_20_14_3_00_38_11]